MVLAPGTRLGSYEIIGPLGAGGMGEVYRARDTALGRDVAIKVLPAVFAQDADRLARFEREARVLASLNHPNIATLHCVEPAGDGRALVMELVEGSGLGEIMRPGTGMRVAEAIAIARQIADALDAAHERGIVHRDLKPANVRLTADGVVKVLDFGLAKSGVEGPSDLTNSPTVIGPTASGVVLGTAPFMSPEQARGKDVDKRTDIWAFGCVLYEMLAGRRAFSGETSSDTIAAILEREPDWSALPASTPLAVRRLLQRCLEKDPKRRLRDIADARADLDQRDPAPPLTAGSRQWLGWAVAALMAVIAAVLVATGATRGTRPGTPPSDPGELQQLTLDAAGATAPSLSADGRLLAYASQRSGRGDLDIWLQQMAGGTPLRITDDAFDDTDPDLSADGANVIFRSERNGGGAYVASALGGPARLAAAEARNPRWSPDGRTIAYWTGQFRGPLAAPSSVFILPMSGGTPTRLMADFEVAREPVWSPDGRALLVVALRRRGVPAGEGLDWWYVPIDGGAPSPTRILDRPGWRGNLEQGRMSAGHWQQSSFLLAIDGGIWSMPLTERGMLRASPRALVFGAGRVSKPTLGRDDHIVFAQLTPERVIERAPLDHVEAPVPATRLVSDANPYPRRGSVTRDGMTIVYESETVSGHEIWRKDLRSGVAQLFLSVQSQTVVNPIISPDGRMIAYVTDSGTEGLSGAFGGTAYTVSVEGGVPRQLCEDCYFFDFTGDNSRAVIIDREGSIQLVDVAKGTRLPLVLKPGPGTLQRATLSPDARWLAFRRLTGQTAKTYIVPATGNASVASAEQIDEPTTNGRPAGWSPDSRVVYLLLDADGSRCLWGQRVDSANGRLIGKPYVARHFHDLGGIVSSSFGNPVTAQGFLYETHATRSNLWRLIPARQAPDQ